MGFLDDLTKKASGIVTKGKNFLADQLSSETTYERDATGNFQVTSTTGNKPKIVKTAKEFLVPGRGYTDAEIKAAQPTTKDSVMGISKAAGEIVQGGLTLTHMLGNKIADTILPGYDSQEAATYRNKINEKVSEKLAPKTAGEAKTMRFTDIAGFAAAPTKVTKLTKVDDLIKASNATDAFTALKANGFTDDAIRAGNLDTKIAAAADEVAVQKVLKDVMPSVKTSNNAPKLKSGLLTQKQIFKDLQYQGYSKQEISDALSLSKSQESLGTTAFDAEDVLSNLKTKSDSASKATTYRGASIKEWEDVKKNGTFNDKEGTVMIDKKTGKPIRYDDAGKNTTTSKELADGYAKNSSSDGGVTIEFKPEAKAKMRFSAKFESTDLQADEFLGEGLDINDVARVTDKNGNVIYESGSQSKKSNTSPIESVAKPTKQFDIPKTPTGEVDVPTYVKQQTELRESARGDKSIKTKTVEFLQNLENKMIDFTSPIQRRYNKAMKTDPLFAASQKNQPRIQDNIDRVFNAPAITAAFVKEKGFAKAVQSIDEADLDAFDQYLTAKHAIDLDTRGITTGRNMQADTALVKAMGPKFEEAAKQIQKYNDERLEYMVESGLISRELKDELLRKHPNYVPFQRVFSEDELANGSGFGSSGVASISKQSVVQKIVGSNREIESPLESLLELTNKAVQQGEKNKAALTLTSYVDIDGNPFGLRKISKTTDAAPDKDTISVLRNGKKEIWEVDADVAKAAKALDVERMNILGKIVSAPLRLARLGITGVFNPAFMLANVARDQLSSFIFSDNGLRSSAANPRVFGAALAEAIKHGKLYDEMLSEGALMTSFDVARDAVKPTLKGVVADKSRISKLKFVAKNPSQWFRQLEDAVGRSEEVARIQQYIGNKQAALAQGMTEAQARVYAARAARENSTNFARRGEYGTVLNNTILYINAGIQGSRLLIRKLKNNPVQTSTKIVTGLMLPVASATYWNLKDPERKRIYDEELQDWEKENNLILILPGAKKGEDGRWEGVLKYPLPPGVGQFANFVRRPIEQSYGLDEVQFKEAAENLLRVVSPTDLTNPVNSLTPQILKPGIQAVTNKDLFTGYDIVPKSLQDRPVEKQIEETTSGTAIDIANTIGVSPVKLEKFMTDTTGALSPQVLNAADRIRGEEQIGGRSIMENISRRFTSAAGGKMEAEQMDELYTLLSESRGRAADMTDSAEDTLTQLEQMPKEQANTELRRIFEENRPLYDKITDVRKDKELGLTRPERVMKQLPVKDGTRAAYIYDQYLEIKASSPEDAKAYLKDLREKKIISDEVLDQLKELKNSQE